MSEDELSGRVKELEAALLDLTNAVQGLRVEAAAISSRIYLARCLRRADSWIGEAFAKARATLPQEHENDEQ